MAQRVEVEIETHDSALELEMFGGSEVSTGTSRVTFSDGSAIVYAGTYVRKGIDFPAIVHLVIDRASDIGTGLISSWLYDKLKGKPAKLRIRRQEVEITPDNIRIVIEDFEREG